MSMSTFVRKCSQYYLNGNQRSAGHCSAEPSVTASGGLQARHLPEKHPPPRHSPPPCRPAPPSRSGVAGQEEDGKINAPTLLSISRCSLHCRILDGKES